jgi:PAS domain S-box-containing protein
MNTSLLPKLKLPNWLLATVFIANGAIICCVYILAKKTNSEHLLILIALTLIGILFLTIHYWVQTQKKQFISDYNSEIEKFALIQHFENLIRYANDIILFTDDQNRILEANDRALEVYGYSREEILLFPIENLFAPRLNNPALEWYSNLKKEGSFLGEAIHICKDASILPVEISARTIILEERVFCQAIIRDITERKVAENALKEREQMLQNQNEEYYALNREFGAICEELSEQNEKLELLNEQLSISENQFRLFMDNFPGGAYIKDSDTRLLYANKSFEIQMGYTLEVMKGKTNSELLAPDKALETDTKDQNVFKTGQLVVEEIENLFKKGNLYLTTNFLIPQPKDQPLLGGIILDLTETRRLEKEVSKLTRAVEQSPVSIVITNTQGDIEYVNPKFTETTGYTLMEALGKNPRILKSDELSTDKYKDLWEIILSGKEWKGEFHNRKKNGELFWENATICPIFDKNGKITHFLAVKEDITKQKQAEKELEENQIKLKNQNEELQKSSARIQEINKELMIAKEKAIESDNLKSAFLANLSHEIRTPMNGIIGFSEMLAMDNLPSEKRRHYTDVIINSTNQLLSIVNDILDLSKIETGQISLSREHIKINKLLIELLSLFKPKADGKNISLIVKKGLDDDKCTIVSDKLRLYQILSNLIGNAVKFTKQGKVTFGYELNGSYLQFFVEDTGIGIPSEYQHRLFGRFQQASSEISRNYGGTGLGLAISKSLVELLKGKIWFTSEQNIGSTFYFTIPFIQIDSIVPGEITKPNETKNIENPITVLLVEDEEINYIFIKEVFDGQPVKLIYASNGIEAIELCKLHAEIDIILMDIKMPLMNGYEATHQIKQFRPHVPIIALTAYAMKEDKEKILSEGLTDYLSKPVKTSDLIKCIKKNLRH